MKHLFALVPLLLSWSVLRAADGQPQGVDFGRDVRPILERACFKCHGPEKQKDGVRFDRRQGAITTADSGKQIISPGRPDASELIRRIETANADERMPPKSDPLSRAQIKILRTWIKQGARWPETKAPASEARREMIVTSQ